MTPKIESLRNRIANRRSRHLNTQDLERELVREIAKQLRREIRQDRKEKAA